MRAWGPLLAFWKGWACSFIFPAVWHAFEVTRVRGLMHCFMSLIRPPPPTPPSFPFPLPPPLPRTATTTGHRRLLHVGDPLRPAALAVHALARAVRHRHHRLWPRRRCTVIGRRRRRRWHERERRRGCGRRQGDGRSRGGGGGQAGGSRGDDPGARDEAPGRRWPDKVRCCCVALLAPIRFFLRDDSFCGMCGGAYICACVRACLLASNSIRSHLRDDSMCGMFGGTTMLVLSRGVTVACCSWRPTSVCIRYIEATRCSQERRFHGRFEGRVPGVTCLLT